MLKVVGIPLPFSRMIGDGEVMFTFIEGGKRKNYRWKTNKRILNTHLLAYPDSIGDVTYESHDVVLVFKNLNGKDYIA